MRIINKYKRALKASSNEIKKPKSFTKGYEFENYVREIVFLCLGFDGTPKSSKHIYIFKLFMESKE